MKKVLLVLVVISAIQACGGGKSVNGASETQVPGAITSFGFPSTTVNPGDTVTVTWNVDRTKIPLSTSWTYDWSVELVESAASPVFCYPNNPGGTQCQSTSTNTGTSTNTNTYTPGGFAIFTGSCTGPGAYNPSNYSTNEAGMGANHQACLFQGSISCKYNILPGPTTMIRGSWECRYPDNTLAASCGDTASSQCSVPGTNFGSSFTARIHVFWPTGGLNSGYDYAFIPNITIN